MKLQNLDTIRERLAESQLSNADLAKQLRIATAIRATGQFFDAKVASTLRAHYAHGYVGLALDEKVEECLLDDSWLDVLQEARERDRELADEQRKQDSGLSGMRWVSERNPYGWAKPELHRHGDHDLPGQWNAFRQCYNLTAVEAVTAKNRDCRRRGCSRYEVLGESKLDKGWRPGQPIPLSKCKAPKLHYDPAEVAAAMPLAVPPAPERKVYGDDDRDDDIRSQGDRQ